MKNALKPFGLLLAIALLIGAAASLYIFRGQTIRTDFIPNEFEYCGKTIGSNNGHYKEIANWLKENEDGWVASYTSYAPSALYKHPAYRVNVLKGIVVVSYKTDYGYPQYVKKTDHGISLECAKDS